MTIDKDQVIDPDINTSFTIGPTSLNEFSTHDEAAMVNTASDQPSVLNSNLGPFQTSNFACIECNSNNK